MASSGKDTLAPLPSEAMKEEEFASPLRRHRTSSSLSDFSLLELDRDEETNTVELNIEDAPQDLSMVPLDTLVVVTETSNLKAGRGIGDALLSSISDLDFVLEEGAFTVRDWAGKKFYSDYIYNGLKYKAKEKGSTEVPSNVVMLFESPSSSSTDSSFHNAGKYKFHDWPPPKSMRSKEILGPNRYSSMNGGAFPVFLRDGKPPEGLEAHWEATIPGYKPAKYVSKISPETDTVYAYLPVEQLPHHVNNPQTHYHLAGKDAIHLMTQQTTRLLPDTRTSRPCVVKTTHSMGSKGIFIIQDDEDEAEFEKFLEESGNPNFVVTDFVDIDRNVACHFFMHPNGSVVWFGSNENHREPDGSFSSDSYLLMEHQEKLKEMQLPFVEEVVQYCHGLGFWGFCGIDVLFDSHGRGYLVDINPRVTGSSPALMVLKLFHDKYNFSVGLFRRTGNIFYHGPAQELMEKVTAYNQANEGRICIVLHSMFQPEGKSYTKMNIGVYGNDLALCKEMVNTFGKKNPEKE